MTDPVDALTALWRSLDADERRRAVERLNDLQAEELAGDDSQYARLLRGLDLVAAHVGRTPTAEDYLVASRDLREAGIEVPPRSQVVKHFDSWERAKEALELWQAPSSLTTARRIEARFKARRLGKVWRYTPETLAETMARCVADLGRPPRVAEFEFWRERELEVARARGDVHAHIPSKNPYRKRWQTWEGALLALGYAPEWIEQRFEPDAPPSSPSPGVVPAQPTG